MASSNQSQNQPSLVKMSDAYGDNTSTNKSVHKQAVHVIRPKIEEYLESNKSEDSCLMVGDIGCADGRNSMDLYKMLSSQDTENSEHFNELLKSKGFKLCLSDLYDHSEQASKYYPGDERVTFQADADFCERIYPISSMDVLLSFGATHWLPTEMGWKGHPYGMHESFTESVRLERKKFAEDLWKKIIAARALELKSGGILLMVNAANHSEDAFGQGYAARNLFDTLYKLSKEFEIETQMNMYQRTDSEFRIPFLDSPQWDSIQSENITVECAYFKQYQSDKEKLGEQAAKEIFGKNITASFRASTESRVKIAFKKKGIDGEELKECLDKFYNRAREECSKDPEYSKIDFKMNMMVAKRSSNK